MRNCYVFFGVLLLLEGVFCVENYHVTISVMEGDSVTLNPGDTKIPEDVTIQWWFGDKFIAEMNKAAKSISEGDDEKFKGRLKLDSQTRPLTITNTRITDSGLYKLLIKGTTVTTMTFKVTVRDYVQPLSVMEGDPVTLDTFTKIQRNDQIKWKFEDKVILTHHLNSTVDVSWKNIHLNNQTGDLTIRNIRRDQSGGYEVEIKNSDNNLILHWKFRITLSEMNFMSVKDGDSVTLQFDTEIQRDDLIQWMFGSTRIAELNKAANTHSFHEDVLGGIFRDRLKLDHQTGSLTITDTRTEHTGLYKVELTSSSRESVSTRFIVTLRQGWTTREKTLMGILIAVLGLVAGFVIYWKYIRPWQNHAIAGGGNGLTQGETEFL